MERQEYILSIMSSAKTDSFTPAQVQKLFFLMDQNITKETGGPHFRFKPYHYGPFDKAVYSELNNLRDSEFVEVIDSGGFSSRRYRLTLKGQLRGEEIFKEFSEQVADYVTKVSDLIRSLSFSQLISSIYKAYPDMKKNSIFSEG